MPFVTDLIDQYIEHLQADLGVRVEFADEGLDPGVTPWVAVGPCEDVVLDYGGQADLREWRLTGRFVVRGYAAAETDSPKARVDAARALGYGLIATAQALHVPSSTAWGELVELTFRELAVFGGGPDEPVSVGSVWLEVRWSTYRTEGY